MIVIKYSIYASMATLALTTLIWMTLCAKLGYDAPETEIAFTLLCVLTGVLLAQSLVGWAWYCFTRRPQ